MDAFELLKATTRGLQIFLTGWERQAEKLN
jgi:hypothetical protein